MHLMTLSQLWEVLTVPCRLNRLFGLLWYDLGVFWLNITCLKSAAKYLLSFYPNKYRSDLSKKLIFDPAGQKASKLEALKVCSDRDSNAGRPESSNSLHRIASKCKLWDFWDFFSWPPTLMACNFNTLWAGPLSYSYSFEILINIS